MREESIGLAARVRPSSSKRLYSEFIASPKSLLYKPDRRHRLITATTDERYEVEAEVMNNFDFRGYRYVRVLVIFDGGVRTVSKYIYNNAIRSYRGESKAAYKYTFKSTKEKKDGQWMNLGFAFGELKVDENKVFSPDEEAKEAQDRGTIKIIFQRGHAVHTEEGTPDEIESPTPCLKTSAKVIKKHCKTHGFKRVIGGNRQPVKEKWTFTPAEGEAGEPVAYTFTYVSHDVLQANTEPKERKAPKQVKTTVPKDQVKTNAPAKQEKRNKRKKKVEYVDLCSDDEEPTRISKVETNEPIPQPIYGATNGHGPTNTDATTTTEIADAANETENITTTKTAKATDSTNAAETTNVPTTAEDHNSNITGQKRTDTDEKPADIPKQSDKARKRARIMLKLEENKLKRELMLEENQLRQELMDLDEE